MRKVLLFLVCCLKLGVAYTQTVWCPAGANWHYSENWMNSGGYIDYKYEKDTVVANVICRKISSTTYDVYYYLPGHVDTSVGNDIFTYSSNDTVFFYSYLSHQFFPYYFFSAQVGDTMLLANTYSTYDSIQKAVVDSTGTIQVNSQNLRYYFFHLTDTCDQISCCGYVFKGMVVERIGMVYSNLVPSWHCVTDDYWYSFRCYEDNSFALYPDTVDCSYLYLNIDETTSVSFTLSPNPVTNQLNITSSVPIQEVNIYNTAGQLVLQTKQTGIDVGNLSKGVYIAQLKTKDANHMRKWIKM